MKTITTLHRKYSKWKSRVEWIEEGVAHLSVVFSWVLPVAYSRAVYLKAQGYHVRAGGPAVAFNPDYLADVAEVGGDVKALLHHNPDATCTSRGCPNKCPFCIVPRIEGDLQELEDWDVKPIVCDNNLLACSRKHFDKVIDALKPLSGIDFNQGLDARLLTQHHAQRLAELDMPYARLAWDDTRLEKQFMRGFERLRKVGIPVRVYVLIGYQDTPEDALYRLEAVRRLHAWPNPMRYQPLDANQRNSYVAPNWTNRQLIRYMRYWSNLRHLGSIPFEKFSYPRRPDAMMVGSPDMQLLKPYQGV